MRRQMHGQPRMMSRPHDCVNAALVNALSDLTGKAATALMPCVVDADSEARTRLSEIGVLIQGVEIVTR